MRFPIMLRHYSSNYEILRRAPGSLPWAMVEAHANQAVRNHAQSVARLAERGGLDPWEAVAVLEDKDYHEIGKIDPHEIVERLWALHDEWVRDQGRREAGLERAERSTA